MMIGRCSQHCERCFLAGTRINYSEQRRRHSSSLVGIYHSAGHNAQQSEVDDQDDNGFSQDLAEYCAKPPNPASLRMLMKTGVGAEAFPGQQHHDSNGHINNRTTAMAEYLRNELPLRLAHRIQDLDQMAGLRDMEDVKTVKGIYIQSFRELIRQFPTPIRTNVDEQAFADRLSQLYMNHSSVLVQMAKGAFQLREQIRQRQKEKRRRQFSSSGNNNNQSSSPMTNDHVSDGESSNEDDSIVPDFETMQDCHHFLDRFYMSRIGIRFLASQYLTLRNHSNGSGGSRHDPNYVGMICLVTSPYAVVRQAAADASQMCRRTFGRCPTVELTGNCTLTFAYIPTYLHYIVLELLKNALRATMEAHETSPGALPVVKVIIADGADNEDVVIKIADEGGGIPRSQMDKIWSYLYTTASPKVQQGTFFQNDNHHHHHQQSDFSKQSPLAGLGYGLPIARSYCRYFGGELDLLSMEGFGTDAFVHLKRFQGDDSIEPVPL
jgi:pyruvate dehydrogenase kinase 2/3/4